MKKGKNVIKALAIVLAVILTACQSASESYLKSFERFVERVEKNASSFTKDDWDKSDVTFSEFTGERYEKVKDQLSRDEKKEIGRLTGRYYKTRLVTTGEDVANDIKSGIDYLRGLGSGLLDGSGIFETEADE